MSVEPVTTNSFIATIIALKQTQFNGKFVVKGPLQEEWIFYLFLGRIIYATGGNHPVKRWRRNLLVHCPEIDFNQLKLPSNISSSCAEALNISWEYQLL